MGKSETNGYAPPSVRRLVLRNYKSIAKCDIEFASFTALVGPNGAGKSNLLDSLRFVSDSLRNSLEYALRDRGGIQQVRRRSKGHPTNFSIQLDLSLPEGADATYKFCIGAVQGGGFAVLNEEYRSHTAGFPSEEHFYRVEEGNLKEASQDLQSAIEPDRLYLTAVSAIPSFRPGYELISRMGFYNLNPDRIRDLQDPDPADVLARDGRNIASVLNRLKTEDAGAIARLEEYLGAIVPGIKGAKVKHLGPKETIEFRQEVPGDENPWQFPAASMSDGTLRALGILVALFQGAREGRNRIPLVGIEEPEAALHPAAGRAMADAILEASAKTQVIITSHSPDLLDHDEIKSESILAVVADKGQTTVGPVDNAARVALRDGLYTTGELLRLGQLQPDPGKRNNARSQGDLFAEKDGE